MAKMTFGIRSEPTPEPRSRQNAAASEKPRSLFELDLELVDLPPDLRWREWMGRVEAAIFASPEPVARETLGRLVGAACRLDELIADIQEELRGRPYELAFVAGGWRHRTRARFADALRVSGALKDPAAPSFDLTKIESLVVAAIAYLQPVTRKQVSHLIGRDISRDIFARLKRIGLIGAGPRAPEAGAPLTYVTTKAFLAAFGLGSLRDLPDIEALQDAGLLELSPTAPQPDGSGDDIDKALGLVDADDDEEIIGDEMDFESEA
jgi:chromosome segregation and condensation protein ScpB